MYVLLSNINYNSMTLDDTDKLRTVVVKDNRNS